MNAMGTSTTLLVLSADGTSTRMMCLLLKGQTVKPTAALTGLIVLLLNAPSAPSPYKVTVRTHSGNSGILMYVFSCPRQPAAASAQCVFAWWYSASCASRATTRSQEVSLSTKGLLTARSITMKKKVLYALSVIGR